AVGCAAIALALLFRTEAGFAAQSQSLVTSALENITNLNRPGQDGYATVWDGNKYVQCKRLPDRNLRCEAARTLMQSSLGHVLTPERGARLRALGWRLDPSFLPGRRRIELGCGQNFANAPRSLRRRHCRHRGSKYLDSE